MRATYFALAAILASALSSAPALAWDSGVHRMVTRVAVAALAPGSLKTAFAANLALLEQMSVEPDLMREAGDKAEGRRHYIDLEYYGSDPFAALDSNRAAMTEHVGSRMLRKSGTLPWAIESESDVLAEGWRDGDCGAVIKAAGFLSHYAADASQPLHTTVHYDGYAQDRGMHARLEGAADAYVHELEREVAPHVRVEQINNAWTPVLAELRASNALVAKAIAADRSARTAAGSSRQLDRILIVDEHDWIVSQLSTAASVLASIWQLDWKRGGRRSICAGR